MPKLPSVGGPAPDQPQDMRCESLNAERRRLLAERDDLNKRPLSSTDAERDDELKQVNAKLYTVEKSLWEKSCRVVANAPMGSVVR
jgi:hypothetical protein